MPIPLCKPSPAKLSESAKYLREIEERAILSNFGPLSVSFEQNLVARMFGGEGECLTVCNATIGLMISIRQAIECRPKSRRRYALMPSFTFPAAAQAAVWNRLIPLYCDINPWDWSADKASERRLLDKYRDDIAVVVPYATFGYDIDIERYEKIQREYDIPVVIDAAASLGTVSEDGRGFGTGFSGSVVYSMHVTKAFSTAEGGLVYSADPELIRTLRSMSNFGFGEEHNVNLMGLNGKMSEVVALLANLRLEDIDGVTDRRSSIIDLYRKGLHRFSFQPRKSHSQAHQFTSTLLPKDMAPFREMIREEMRRRGVASATYFSPHVAELGYFRDEGALASMPVTRDIASRVLTLPLYDTMTDDEVREVISAVNAALSLVDKLGPRQPSLQRQEICR
jgi:dTDP-4-amino-4,6-dideoxygalactose transaminase